MDGEYVPEFEGAYLEDSYFLGLVAEHSILRLRFLFALTASHADYAPPNPGEQHCYREGNIVIERASIMDWEPGKPTLRQDPDGAFDLGSVELYRRSGTCVRFVTEWFDATVKAERIRLELTGADV